MRSILALLLACLLPARSFGAEKPGNAKMSSCESKLSSVLFNLSEFDLISRSKVEMLERDIRLTRQVIEHASNRLKGAKSDKEKKHLSFTLELEFDRLKYEEAQLKQANEQLKQQANLPSIADRFKTHLAKNARLGRHARDYLNYLWIKALPKDSTVAFLVGAPGEVIGSAEFEKIKTLVLNLLSNQMIVVVDGHSPQAPELVSLGQGRVIAVTSGEVAPAKDFPWIHVSNPYLYMRAFAEQRSIFATLNSVLGASLSLQGLLNGYISELPGSVQSLHKWSESIQLRPEAFGLKVLSPLPILTASSIGSRLKNKHTPTLPKFDIDERESSELRLAALYANQMFLNRPEIEGPKAVLFGSSSMSEKSSPLAYEIAWELGRRGFGVATGGAGGAMLAANMGAHDAGGLSLGIPIDKSMGLTNEKNTFSQYHTSTTFALSYWDRIPWLLRERRLIIVAPGGSGTVQEIAASLVYISLDSNKQRSLIFLKKDYFSELERYLKSLPLSKSLKDRISIIDSTSELDHEIKRLEKSGFLTLSDIVPTAALRSERKALPDVYYSDAALTSQRRFGREEKSEAAAGDDGGIDD